MRAPAWSRRVSWTLAVATLFTGSVGAAYEDEGPCGVDDRGRSEVRAVARLRYVNSPKPGTAFLLPNGKLVSAGHCFDDAQPQWVEFNVPLSSVLGDPQPAADTDWYRVNHETVHHRSNREEGDDWAVFEVYPNDITNLTPLEAQGASLPVARGRPADSITLIGHGRASGILNYVQQTSTDVVVSRQGTKIDYWTDADLGSSGSPALNEEGFVVGVHTTSGCPGRPNSCTAVENQAFWEAMGLAQFEVDQVLHDSTRVGTLSRWTDTGFSPRFMPPRVLSVALNSVEVLQADTIVHAFEKYNRWNNDPDVRNHHEFLIDGTTDRYVANFLPTYGGATIAVDLINARSSYNGSITFLDPWYLDFNDPDYGGIRRNRGHAQAYPNSRPAPFSPSLDGAFPQGPYRGVFLSQGSDWQPPYYSVGAPETQPIGGLPSYFLRWDANPNSATFRYPGSTTTGVAFNAANATVTALYKAHLRSGSASALYSNSQRKVIRDSVGCYHMVYESGGHIWHVRSTDEGITWSPERRLSQEGSIPATYSSASLTVLPESRRVAAVWEWRDASTTCVQLGLLDDRTGEPVSIRDVATYYVSQTPGTMPVAGVARHQSSPYLLVAWYDASSERVRGRVMDPEGNLGSEIELLTHPVNSISLTPTAEAEWWGLASSDGTSVSYRRFLAPNATGETEETVAWGSEDLQQRYPSVAFGMGPSIDPGVAWEEYGWEINRRVVKYRERRAGYWQPVVVFTDNTSHPDYHSPSMTANEFTQAVTIAWRSGAEELRSVSRDWRGEWSEQTVLPVTGSDPALSLGRDQASDNRELLAYRGISQLYTILTTPVQPLGGGDEESPTAGGEEYQREGRGVSVVFPSGSLRLALVDATFNGRSVGFGRFPDTLEIRTAERVETTLQSEPLNGTGVLECTLLSQTTGEVPAAGEIRLVLRDRGIVTTVLRSFRSGADSVQRVRIPLSLGAKARRIGVQFWGLGTVRTVEPERWIVGGSGGDANLAQKALLRPEEVPAEFRLHPSYPNPFNPSTEIRFELPEPARASLVIYDVLGRVVETLLVETKEAGYHTVNWNAAGRSSGVYLARFRATTATGTVALQQTMKLVLTK